ncbi:phiSA1p31-related protein [Streptomyces sp. NPDC026672]|uniref:phiSA1p31-related protein n=1 Tax=Actinomycetes TaxID=1760 RepID=UPI0033CF024E
MTETFKVGQKVRVNDVVDGEVTYGPFSSTFGMYRAYVVRIGGTEKLQKERDLSAIPETPKFSVGDVVTLATRPGAKATVEYGPFDDRDTYVVKLVDEPTDPDSPRTFTAMEHVMAKAAGTVKVGDRVRVVRARWAAEFHGKTGVVTSTSRTWREAQGDIHRYEVRMDNADAQILVAEVDPVSGVDTGTYTYDGVTYDLSAKYRDKDGDIVRLALVDGIARARYYGNQPDQDSHTLEYVVDRYAPLTRVTD